MLPPSATMLSLSDQKKYEKKTILSCSCNIYYCIYNNKLFLACHMVCQEKLQEKEVVPEEPRGPERGRRLLINESVDG